MCHHISYTWCFFRILRIPLNLKPDWKWILEYGTIVAKEAANLVEHGSGWKLEHFSEKTQSPSVGHPQHHVSDTTW